MLVLAVYLCTMLAASYGFTLMAAPHAPEMYYNAV